MPTLSDSGSRCCGDDVGVMAMTPNLSSDQEFKLLRFVVEGVPHCLLLSRMAHQSSDQDSRRL